MKVLGQMARDFGTTPSELLAGTMFDFTINYYAWKLSQQKAQRGRR